MKVKIGKLIERLLSNENARKKAGCIVVIIIFLFVGLFVRDVIFDIGSEKQSETNEAETITETVDTVASGEEDVSYEKAAATMKLDIDMPKQLKERIDYVSFVRGFERYLTDQDFWSDVSRAESDYMLVEDLKTGEIIMTFTLNDYQDTTVVVTVEAGNTFTFNHY